MSTGATEKSLYSSTFSDISPMSSFLKGIFNQSLSYPSNTFRYFHISCLVTSLSMRLLKKYTTFHDNIWCVQLSFSSMRLPEHPGEIMGLSTDSLFPLAQAQESRSNGVSFFKDSSELFQELQWVFPRINKPAFVHLLHELTEFFFIRLKMWNNVQALKILTSFIIGLSTMCPSCSSVIDRIVAMCTLHKHVHTCYSIVWSSDYKYSTEMLL